MKKKKRWAAIRTYSFPVRFKMTSTGPTASSSLLILRALRNATVVSEASPVAMTIPGLSSSMIFESSATSCMILLVDGHREVIWKRSNRVVGVTYLVTPGTAPTLQDLLRFKLLMMLLLPTFGRPTTPTRMDVLMPLLRA